MTKKKETEKKIQETEKRNPHELEFDDLDVVQGGGLGNVQYTSTTSISSDTRNKI